MDRHRPLKKIVLILIILLLSACGTNGRMDYALRPSSTVTVEGASPFTPVPSASPAPTSAPTRVLKTRTPAPSPTPTQGIAPTAAHDWNGVLDPILNRGGIWHVVVRGPMGEVIFQRNGDDIIHPASVIKVAIGMLVLAWLEEQYGDLDQVLAAGPPKAGRSYQQLLKAMLVYSEEEAADLLQQALVEGYGWKKINQRLVEWGAVHTSLVPRRSSASDIANLLEDIYEREIPSRPASRILLDLLSQVTQGDKVRLWALKGVLPEGSVIYNKRGSLTDPLIVADVGIIRLSDGSAYILCLFGYPDEKTTFEALDKTISDFSLAWYSEMVRR